MIPQKKIFIYVSTLLGVFGCVDKKYEFNLHKNTPQESAVYALKSSDSDIRYKTLVELANSKAIKDDWAVKAMTIVARTDPSPSVRALAIHNLGRVGDKRVLPTLIEAFEDDDARVRIESAWATTQVDIFAKGTEEKIIQDAKKVLVKTLAEDSSIDVRLNSAKALGQFKDHDVLLALIAALKDAEFVVRHESERSLIRLTGITFQGNVDRWLAWTQQTKDHFKNAGQIPPQLAEPKRNIFQQSRENLYLFYLDWQGPAKR
ncbi:MAG: HEAT repeat domain-containing protein [Phycisphaerae bacterium]